MSKISSIISFKYDNYLFRFIEILDMKKVKRSLKIKYYFSNSSKISKLGQKAILASKLIE